MSLPAQEFRSVRSISTFGIRGALSQAALQRHMDEVGLVLETVCREQTGSSLQKMATALVTSFLEAKMKDAKGQRCALFG